MFIFNLKAYREASGEKGLALAKLAKRWSNLLKVDAVIAPGQADLSFLNHFLSQGEFFHFFAQHADVVHAGQFTGSVSLEGIKKMGCSGVLLNHAEKKITRRKIAELVEGSAFYGLKSVVCAKDGRQAADLARLNPWAVAVEIPELIGTGVSISQAKPEVFVKALEKIREKNASSKVFAGAGVASGEDVVKARELGAEGIVLSSRFVFAQDHSKKLQELLGGWKA